MYDSNKTAIDDLWEINLDDVNFKLKRDLSTSRKAISLNRISRNLSTMFEHEISNKKIRTSKKSASLNLKIRKKKSNANYELSSIKPDDESVSPNVGTKINPKKLEKIAILQNLKNLSKDVRKNNLNLQKEKQSKNITINDIF